MDKPSSSDRPQNKYHHISLMMMLLLCASLLCLIGSTFSEDYVHSPIQYQSQGGRGSYNFGYDTGLTGSHQFHQESRGDDGVVRGKYGYTDPNGKLRLVYYSSDANGYKTWGPEDLPENKDPLPPPAITESKVSSRIIYPLPPASKVLSIKSSKQIVEPLPPAKTVQREQVVVTHKTHYSPADTFRARLTSNQGIKSKTIVRSEVKGGSSPIIVQQQQKLLAPVKSLSIKSANRPVPITPAQYKSNYPPAGRYSRCYCE